MKIKDIVKKIEEVAPLESAMDFDNVGLLVGSDNSNVNGVLICVDVTENALVRAIENNCNLIISHHPIIFNAISNFLTDDYKNDIIAKAFINDISIYSAHTNVDKMSGNMSWVIAKQLGCNDIESLTDDGIGAFAVLEKPINIESLTKNIKKVVNESIIKTVGCLSSKVSKIAIVNGSGGSDELLNAVKNKGAEVYISSEFKHHNMLEAMAMGIKLIEIGHYASEQFFIEIIANCMNCYNDIKIVKHYEGNPYN